MDCIGNRTLNSVLAHRVAASGDRECIVFEDAAGRVSRYSYAALQAWVGDYACLFASRGITRGDRVVVHMQNCPEYLFTWFALARLGAVMVPTNILASAFELEHCVSFSEAVAVITDPARCGVCAEVLPRCEQVRDLYLARTVSWYPNEALFPEGIVVIEDALSAELPAVPAEQVDPLDDALILFSAGTKAQANAVRLTHANAVFAGTFGAQAAKLTPADRSLLVLPLFHVNGLFISVMPAFLAGATLIMTEQFSASRYMDQVRRHRATTSSLVSAAVRMILNQPPHDLDSRNDLRLIMYAIAISDEEWDLFENRFDVKLCDLWGMTETLGATTINPVDGLFKKNCIGLPRLGNEVKIVDSAGQEVPVGTVGEIVVRGVPGRTLMKGYDKEPEATAQIMSGEWLHTGDMGYMDGDGYFHFKDRIKNVIKRAGENISASEVEQVLQRHAAVAEAVVVAVPDQMRDEAVSAFLVLHQGKMCAEQEIIDWCGEHMAQFKVPSYVRFLEEIPRDEDGNLRLDVLMQHLTP